MMELRWNCTTEEETVIPPVSQIQFGKPFERQTVVKKKLQYRVYQNTAIYAGMPDQDFMNKTAKMAWSEWRDVPEYVETDTSCP
jgi:hypothetical protein